MSGKGVTGCDQLNSQKKNSKLNSSQLNPKSQNSDTDGKYVLIHSSVQCSIFDEVYIHVYMSNSDLVLSS